MIGGDILLPFRLGGAVCAGEEEEDSLNLIKSSKIIILTLKQFSRFPLALLFI